VPLFTVAIYRLYYARSYSTATYLSLIPIVAGAGLTTMGEYHYSTTGLMVTCLGVALAALKVCSFLMIISYILCLLSSHPSNIQRSPIQLTPSHSILSSHH
jgi:hypothetical protein